MQSARIVSATEVRFRVVVPTRMGVAAVVAAASGWW
jgi:hypothetical protein